MINIVTSADKIKYDYVFDDCESFFRAKVHSKQFNSDDLYAINIIDNAVLLDKNTGAIKTDSGITMIDYLSSGCKIILVFLYIIRNKSDYNGSVLLDVTEGGANALDVLFDFAEKYDGIINITFLLRHRNSLFKCKSHNYLFDGKRKTKLL